MATGAYDDLIALLETLRGDDWRAPTECPAWNVADMVGHLIGSAKAAASKRELLRQNLYGFRHAREYDGNAMDAYDALQVAEHASLTPAERVAALKALTAGAVRGRMRTPAFLRAVSVSAKSNGSIVEGMPNKGNVGHLMDVIYTRDVFMHRIDISRAVGRELSPGENDRRIVEDAVGGGEAPPTARRGRSVRPRRREARAGLRRATHRDGRARALPSASRAAPREAGCSGPRSSSEPAYASHPSHASRGASAHERTSPQRR